MNAKFQLIKDINYKPKDSQLGVIIKKVTSEQNHTGFVFIEDNKLVLAHFGWHETYFFFKDVMTLTVMLCTGLI